MTATPKPRAGEHAAGPDHRQEVLPPQSSAGDKWRVAARGGRWLEIVNQHGGRICEIEYEDRARRIVACVNACEGVENAELEDLAALKCAVPGVAGVAQMAILNDTLETERDSLAAQNRELREALASIDQLMMSMPLTSKIEHQVHGIAHRALTKVRPAS